MKTPSIIFLLLALAPISAQAEIPKELTFSFLKNQPHFDCSLVGPPSSDQEVSLPETSQLRRVASDARLQGFKGSETLIQLVFDDNGFVQDVTIAKTSRNLAVDTAAVNWARCARVVPGKYKTTILPVEY